MVWNRQSLDLPLNYFLLVCYSAIEFIVVFGRRDISLEFSYNLKQIDLHWICHRVILCLSAVEVNIFKFCNNLNFSP